MMIHDLFYGKVSVMGCPAEENGGGGKIALKKKDAFSDLSSALMCHPFPRTMSRPLKFGMLM